MVLFIISVAIIGMFTAAVSLHYVDATSDDKGTQCVADSSYASKCLQKDNTPFLLPFP